MDAGISMKDFMVSSNAGKVNNDYYTGKYFIHKDITYDE